jgi:hypothetical protein
MTRGSSRDLLDALSDFLAHRKGLPVLVGVGLALASLVLACVPSLTSVAGFWGWVARSHVLLHVGVIVGLLGILVGDAL